MQVTLLQQRFKEDNMKETKEVNLFREVLIPVLSAVIIGGLSSYFTASLAIAVLKEKVSGIEQDIDSVRIIAQSVQSNQIELSARGQWMSNIEMQIGGHETRLTRIEDNRYTKEDAERDIELLRLKLLEGDR
jgi:hypothetical protein